VISQKLSVENGFSALFRAGGGKDDEEKEWQSTSVTPLPILVGSVIATSRHSHWLRDNLYFYFNNSAYIA